MKERILLAGVVFCACLAVAALVGLRREHAQAPGGALNTGGAVVAHIAGRLLVDAGGGAQLVGYYPYIAGITGPFFSGTPGEATAFFTFRSTSFQVQLVPNGNIAYLLSTPAAGTTYVESVYLNSRPNQDFQDPNTFSAGQLIARFGNVGFMGTLTQFAGAEAGTLTLMSSQDFTFQGQTYNLANLSPAVTISLTFPATPIVGAFTSPPVVVPFGGYAIAVEGTRRR